MKKVLTNTLAALFALFLAIGCSDGLVSGYDIPEKQTKPKEEKEEEKEKEGEETKPDVQEEEFTSAAEAVVKMGAGWNLGNTLDSNSGNAEHMWIEAFTSRSFKDYETAWGQPVTTRALIL